MESKNELQESDIKNHTYYYSNDIIEPKHFGINNILIDEKPYENIPVYKISYKSLIDSKPLLIRFNKMDGLIMVYDGTKYLVLFGSKIYDSIYNRLRYLVSEKRGIAYIISHNCVQKSK